VLSSTTAHQERRNQEVNHPELMDETRVTHALQHLRMLHTTERLHKDG